MTLHLPQPSLRDALNEVISIAAQINEDDYSVFDRANTAISYAADDNGAHWPLSFQRQVLAAAIEALDGETAPESTAAPVKSEGKVAPQPTPAPQPQPVELQPQNAPAAAVPQPVRTKNEKPAPDKLLTLSHEVIRSLLEVLDFSDLAAKPRDEQNDLIRSGIEALAEERKLHLNSRETAQLIDMILADMLGLGPLELLLADEEITDIMVNGPDNVYVERGGQLERTAVRFRDNDHVFSIASRIVSAVGRRIDEAQPMVDARLADGSRVNVAIPPLSIDGPTITIRKFPSKPVQLDRLVANGSMSKQMSALLGLATYLRLNILVSGGTGSGKTTLINAMSAFIPESERVVTIEDAAELRFQQPHVVRFETRPPNVEGAGEVTMRTLMRNALRMRPDRIIIGEVRGDEVLDLLQAMNTGHDGSMSTLHANSPREALTRVESMAALAGFAPGAGVVRRQLADAVHLIVQVSRMRDGTRRVTSISELAGIDGETITLQELFTFRVDPESTRQKVTGQYVTSGYRPKFAQRAADYGVSDELNALLGV